MSTLKILDKVRNKRDEAPKRTIWEKFKKKRKGSTDQRVYFSGQSFIHRKTFVRSLKKKTFLRSLRRVFSKEKNFVKTRSTVFSIKKFPQNPENSFFYRKKILRSWGQFFLQKKNPQVPVTFLRWLFSKEKNSWRSLFSLRKASGASDVYRIQQFRQCRLFENILHVFLNFCPFWKLNGCNVCCCWYDDVRKQTQDTHTHTSMLPY